MRTRNLVSIPRRELSLLALLPLLFPSCSVFFVSPYDEMTDRAATELVTKTANWRRVIAAYAKHA